MALIGWAEIRQKVITPGERFASNSRQLCPEPDKKKRTFFIILLDVTAAAR